MERVKVPSEKQTILFEPLTIEGLLGTLSSMSSDYCINSARVLREIIAKDKKRLFDSINITKTQKTLGTLEDVIGKKNLNISNLAKDVSYDHKALLLFADPNLISNWLFINGFESGTVIPSVNVAKRLEKRYGFPCPVAIWRTDVDSQNGQRQIELFLPSPESIKLNAEIAQREQRMEFETHTAFTVNANANYSQVVADLLSTGLSFDGNMTENRIENSSTQYFINSLNAKRVELIKYNLH